MAVSFQKFETGTHRWITPARKVMRARALFRQVLDLVLSVKLWTACSCVDVHACLYLHMVSENLAGCKNETCDMPPTLRTQVCSLAGK